MQVGHFKMQLLHFYEAADLLGDSAVGGLDFEGLEVFKLEDAIWEVFQTCLA